MPAIADAKACAATARSSGAGGCDWGTGGASGHSWRIVGEPFRTMGTGANRNAGLVEMVPKHSSLSDAPPLLQGAVGMGAMLADGVVLRLWDSPPPQPSPQAEEGGKSHTANLPLPPQAEEGARSMWHACDDSNAFSQEVSEPAPSPACGRGGKSPVGRASATGRGGRSRR